jgi:molybdenum cofactor cytidylyltransferase
MVQLVNSMGDDSGLFTLVLAAGSARRFGSPKQLADFKGQTLLQRALGLARQASGSATVLVVGDQWQLLIDGCRGLSPFVVRNEQPERGMASSIACGMRTIRSAADWVLILLVDQPLITAEHLAALQDASLASPTSIIATGFANITGAPAIFPAVYFDALLSLQGDQGARSIINNNSDDVISIAFADAAIDIDTPEDFQGL